MINVGIIDPDRSSRAIVCDLLTQRHDFHIAVLFELDRIAAPPNARYSPHVILMDFKGQPPRVIRKVKDWFPQANVLVLTNNLHSDAVNEALRNGALSYLDKETCWPYLLHAVITTKDGVSVLDPRVSQVVLGHMFRANLDEELLTARELQVARAMAAGLSYQGVADKYRLALDTVRTYVKRIYRKLDINSKGELIARFRWSMHGGR